jgi:hypothetical protein
VTEYNNSPKKFPKESLKEEITHFENKEATVISQETKRRTHFIQRKGQDMAKTIVRASIILQERMLNSMKIKTENKQSLLSLSSGLAT